MVITLFLDIDGVLNRYQPPDQKEIKGTKTSYRGHMGMEPELLSRLDGILDDFNCQVVISSTWGYNERTIRGFLKFGFRNACKIVGGTCRKFNGRGRQIKDYCEENKIINFIVLDDETTDINGNHKTVTPEIKEFFKGRVCKTEGYQGLTKAKAKELRSLIERNS